MSKIIIHNELDDELEAMVYIEISMKELKKMNNLSYIVFKDNTRVQIYHQKTCDTYYVYRVGDKDD